MDYLLAQHAIPEVIPIIGVFILALALLIIVPIKLLISCMMF